MIEYVNVQLSIWGKWAVSRSTKGLGYPGVSPMFQQMQHGGVYRSREPAGVAEYVHETDQAVQRLGAEDRALCVEFYQRGGTGVAIAKRLGLARRTLYNRIDSIHCAVLGHLNDIAAGC